MTSTGMNRWLVFILQSIKPRVETANTLNLRRRHICVFILQSIKPRVETGEDKINAWRLRLSLSYNPSNQGLKPWTGCGWDHPFTVFILQSIKPRVETQVLLLRAAVLLGLYPTIHQTKGWNHPWPKKFADGWESLSYNPSNQGLKQKLCKLWRNKSDRLYPTIHQTKGWNSRSILSYLMQALVFILQSIKPRVETLALLLDLNQIWCLYPTIHQTKGWNTKWTAGSLRLSTVFILQSIKPRVETSIIWVNQVPQPESLSYNPSNQGLKPGSRRPKG